MDVKPDYLFHLAAQSLVHDSFIAPQKTWETNLIGTVNVLNALRKVEHLCKAVFVTSDKCYENVEWVWGYKETDRLGGADPYSASKAAAEIAISSFNRSFLKNKSRTLIGSARAGNVIGGGDWAKNRVVPDFLRAWEAATSLEIRNPSSTRPWQHVLEPLSGYLAQASTLTEETCGESFNFGPHAVQNYSVVELIERLAPFWPGAKYEANPSSINKFYESQLLKLNCDKAAVKLEWRPVLSFDETIEFTANWYRKYKENADCHSVSVDQIIRYCSLAQERGLKWTDSH